MSRPSWNDYFMGIARAVSGMFVATRLLYGTHWNINYNRGIYKDGGCL